MPSEKPSFSLVPPEKRNQASGLINLSRNLGGSVGIAIATTLLDRYSQTNQSILGANMTATSPAYQAGIRQIARQLVWRGQTAMQAIPEARGILYNQLIRQSTMLAYVDVFHLMAIVCFSTLILVLFLKKSNLKKGDIPVH